LSDVPGKTYFSRAAGHTGFKADSLEKVYRLMTILGRIQAMPELSNNLALKGGTAIQGQVFGFRRLSVDIDLNYVGSLDRNIMQKDRGEIRRSMVHLFKDLGYRADAPVSMYAEEQFDIHFKNCGGGADHLKVEINYLERMPVIGTIRGRLTHPFDDLDPLESLTYRPEELFAGKMRALVLRGTPRDIFDANLILQTIQKIDGPLLRKLALFYLSMYGDVRTMGTDASDSVTGKDMLNNLVPMLSRAESIDTEAMKVSAMSMVRDLLALTAGENEFFRAMYSEKRIEQDLLFEGMPVQRDLRLHPSIVWRLMSIK